MRKGYPVWIKQAGVEDGWKRAPVAWESCWDMRRWVKEGWPLRFIFNYALALHGSGLNNKSAPLSEGPGIREEIEQFVRRLGYRLSLAVVGERDVRPVIRLAIKGRGDDGWYRLSSLAIR